MNKKDGIRVKWTDFQITGGFWEERQVINRKKTIPYIYDFSKKSGRIDSIKGVYRPDPSGNDILADRANGKEEGVFHRDGTVEAYSLAQLSGLADLDKDDEGKAPRPHFYWDSDVAKWVEAASYSLYHEPDQKVKEQIEQIIDDYEKLQQEDGYLNTYFTFVEPGKRFTNIQEKHELYCAGHLLEAAIAYFEATGKRRFLDIICRYLDYIMCVIGPEEGQLHAYPGHQELELALVRLFRLTREEKYLKYAEYLILERGRQPLYFDLECEREGRNPNKPTGKGFGLRDGLPQGPYAHFQSHLPVTEQKEAVGHAVRMMYQCCGMTDVAAETGNEALAAACETLWENVTLKKMYVTGGIGAEAHGERFSFAYHLPPMEAYNETCASVGLAMWAYRMLLLKTDRKYADVMERVIYNGLLSGVSGEGDHFFYANHLKSIPMIYLDRVERQTRMFPVRQNDFPVSCCPANLARFIESVTGYFCSIREETVYVHLYLSVDGKFEIDARTVRMKMETAYPFGEQISVDLFPEEEEQEFGIGLRIPAWCDQSDLNINGENVSCDPGQNGYIIIRRKWEKGDRISLRLVQKPYLLEANPSADAISGMACIGCGPVIYCLEEADNGDHLSDIILDSSRELNLIKSEDLTGCGFLKNVPRIEAYGWRNSKRGWENRLYRKLEKEDPEPVKIRAIPYYLWANRGVGEMAVWIRYR